MVEGIDHEYLQDVAANTEYTLDGLESVAETLVSVLQSDILDHYHYARVRDGRDYWMLEYNRQGVWLAFTRPRLAEILRDAGHDVERELVYAVGFAFLESFQANGRTIKVPGVISRSLKDPFFVPIYVPFSDDFLNGMEYALLQLQRFVWRYKLSPAEALDYWATQRMSRDMANWAGKRNVGPEAVRKNVRQAREKLKPVSPDPKSRQKIRSASVDEIPDDKPHDEKADVFYIPDQDSAESYLDESPTADS